METKSLATEQAAEVQLDWIIGPGPHKDNGGECVQSEYGLGSLEPHRNGEGSYTLEKNVRMVW